MKHQSFFSSEERRFPSFEMEHFLTQYSNVNDRANCNITCFNSNRSLLISFLENLSAIVGDYDWGDSVDDMGKDKFNKLKRMDFENDEQKYETLFGTKTYIAPLLQIVFSIISDAAFETMVDPAVLVKYNIKHYVDECKSLDKPLNFFSFLIKILRVHSGLDSRIIRSGAFGGLSSVEADLLLARRRLYNEDKRLPLALLEEYPACPNFAETSNSLGGGLPPGD